MSSIPQSSIPAGVLCWISCPYSPPPSCYMVNVYIPWRCPIDLMEYRPIYPPVHLLNSKPGAPKLAGAAGYAWHHIADVYPRDLWHSPGRRRGFNRHSDHQGRCSRLHRSPSPASGTPWGSTDGSGTSRREQFSDGFAFSVSLLHYMGITKGGSSNTRRVHFSNGRSYSPLLDNNPHVPVYLIDSRAPFIMSLGTNALLMCFAGGRVWYAGRQVQIVQIHRGFRNQYNTAIALLLESGAMYCLCLVLWVVSLTLTPSPGFSTESASIFSGITGALVGQTVNIAPTVILVRVGGGHWQWNQDDPRRSSSQRTVGSRIVFKSAATSYPIIEIK
ncbi:hypothetical protein DFH09DRAFT_1155553 [Mycena vulgaris]|nr:hypothetical protein DFH09DRAFT_1155553 [Mycena vulgaris]